MGRHKLGRSKTRNTYSLENLEQLRELRDKLAPMGLQMTDSQAIDVIVTVMHRVIFDERLQVVDTDKMLAVMNKQFTVEFSKMLVQSLEFFGQKDVRTEWQPDGSVVVWAGSNTKAVIPPKMFAGKIFDAESLLRDAPTGLPV